MLEKIMGRGLLAVLRHLRLLFRNRTGDRYLPQPPLSASALYPPQLSATTLAFSSSSPPPLHTTKSPFPSKCPPPRKEHHSVLHSSPYLKIQEPSNIEEKSLLDLPSSEDTKQVRYFEK